MFSCFRRFFCMCQKRERFRKEPYILELTDDKYYVGESNNIERRIWAHENGNGSAWTKKYNVIKSIEPEYNSENNLNELIQTLTIMRENGIDNVRGSLFTNPYSLSPYDKVMAAQLYCELHGLCRKCGGKGHFITQCKEEDVEEWVQQFGGVLQFENIDTRRICLGCDTEISSLPKNYRYCRKCFYEKNKY